MLARACDIQTTIDPPEVNDSVCHWLQSQWGPRIYIVTQPATYTRSERTVPL